MFFFFFFTLGFFYEIFPEEIQKGKGLAFQGWLNLVIQKEFYGFQQSV